MGFSAPSTRPSGLLLTGLVLVSLGTADGPAVNVELCGRGCWSPVAFQRGTIPQVQCVARSRNTHRFPGNRRGMTVSETILTVRILLLVDDDSHRIMERTLKDVAALVLETCRWITLSLAGRYPEPVWGCSSIGGPIAQTTWSLEQADSGQWPADRSQRSPPWLRLSRRYSASAVSSSTERTSQTVES